MMNSEEIKERLALIGALAEDAQAGFETMLVPFLLYGIAIPAGTAATYFFVHLELAKFVWRILVARKARTFGFCRRIVKRIYVRGFIDCFYCVFCGISAGPVCN